jgi:hypothetical protein
MLPQANFVIVFDIDRPECPIDANLGCVDRRQSVSIWFCFRPAANWGKSVIIGLKPHFF